MRAAWEAGVRGVTVGDQTIGANEVSTVCKGPGSLAFGDTMKGFEEEVISKRKGGCGPLAGGMAGGRVRNSGGIKVSD